MGDPAGIGPEICLDLLARVDEGMCPLVFGDAGVLRRVARLTGRPEPEVLGGPEAVAGAGRPGVIDFSAVADAGHVVAGRVDAACGRAALAYIAAAIDAALAGEVDAVTTGPVHKEALRAAGCPHAGHTEIFAARTGTAFPCMMLTSKAVTCSLVTTHVGLGEVPALLTTDGIARVIALTHDAMRLLCGRKPRLAVPGLNPHAGEGGLFGRREEEEIIAPAIAMARAAGMDVEGPLAPDTAFLPARRECTDAYVCMYHDQGLIPLKMLAFESAVNVTLGLPVVRTSVGHGTAFDIAWQGKASPGSLFEAVRLAARLAGARRGA
jgi:4-phospho-D-threonate 3-dehydrogenase / 4-phospho-D-erythronate 3-dehydrogenase